VSRVALQLYTVREECAADLPDALATVASLGFDGVELYDLCGRSADAVRGLLDRNGLVACSRHVGLPLIEGESERLAEEMRALGTDRLVVNWIEPPRTAREADIVCDRLLAVRAQTARLGLRLGFHNHDGELAALEDGRSVLDRLLAAGAAAPFLELDLAWIWYAGLDPLSFLERVGRGAPLVHVKDLRRDGAGPRFVPLGGGEIDFGRLAEVADAARVEWLIVEQDETNGEGFGAVAASLVELRRLVGAPA
jgi:sugar phosphate isomerase/epimerase